MNKPNLRDLGEIGLDIESSAIALLHVGVLINLASHLLVDHVHYSEEDQRNDIFAVLAGASALQKIVSAQMDDIGGELIKGGSGLGFAGTSASQ